MTEEVRDWLQGLPTETRLDLETGERVTSSLAVVTPDAEFPTPWHREAHIAALRRELEGAEYRARNASFDNHKAMAVIEAANARRELKRLGA